MAHVAIPEFGWVRPTTQCRAQNARNNDAQIINLVTPKADKQPRARPSALPLPVAAAVSSFLNLTADTPSPVSAQGIAGDDNDCRNGDAHHHADHPPDLPHLPGTSNYV